MTTKTKPLHSAILRSVATSPAWTPEERLRRIEVMAQRVNSYVQSMCQAALTKSASAETLERAIGAFYEQMIVMERQLGRIHDDFKLE